MEDAEGHLWHTSTMRICKNHNFERRIGLWSAGYDADGELFCNQRYGDWPQDMDALKADLKDKITLLSGHSGVGKSTIINKLVPGVNLRTGDISEYHNKGMHTTTFSEMISLPGGGYLIDTPGIKGFGTIEMADAEISHYFRELFKYSEECRFNNCTHRHEPGCAVIQAVNDGLISESRYKSYLSILDDRMESKYREEF